MKITDKKKPVSTIPQGVWESSRPDPHKEKSGAATESTDLQGNGYPKEQNKKSNTPQQADEASIL